MPAITLPGPDDWHVLAAGIVGRCDAIETQNLKDFPPEALAPFGIETQHPDDFFRNQLSLAPGLVCSMLRRVRAHLKNPPDVMTNIARFLPSKDCSQPWPIWNNSWICSLRSRLQ